MHGTIPAARKKIIERIATAARRVGKRGDPAAAQSFLRQYYRGVGEEDLGQYSAAQLAASALSQLRFAATRKRGRAAVRVFNTDAARDGWSSAHTIVEVVVDDMPFLVDSISMVLNQAILTIHLMIHPIIGVRRDSAGRLVQVNDGTAADAGFSAESWQHIEIDRINDVRRQQELERTLQRVIDDVRLAVSDWPADAATGAGDRRRTSAPVLHRFLPVKRAKSPPCSNGWRRITSRSSAIANTGCTAAAPRTGWSRCRTPAWGFCDCDVASTLSQ